MTINPLIPYLPAFLSFLIYGWITGGLFAFGRRGRHGCLFTIGFWYFYAVWIIFFGLLLSVQSGANQLWFLAGFLIPQIKHLWHHNSVQMSLAFFETILDFIGRCILFLSQSWAEHQNKPTAESMNGNQAEPPHQREAEDEIKREQARREAEARERREQTEQARQEQARKTEPPEATDRTPEEILGLKPQWTAQDLQTAYRREAGRTHPDKWIGKPESIRQAMEAEYKMIQEAYQKLKNPV